MMTKVKLYLGLALLAISCLVPLLGFWIGALELPAATKGVLIGLMVLGGPELLFLLAIALLGKPAYELIKIKVIERLNLNRPTTTQQFSTEMAATGSHSL